MFTREEKIPAEAQPQAERDLEPQVEETARPDPEVELRSTIDRLQRLQAEFENYKKRAMREAAAHEQRVSDRVILDFLPLYDNLQRAFQSLSSNNDVKAFVSGVELIFAQFQQVLETHAVAPIDVTGQSFDPELHEAMLSVPSPVKKDMIVEELMPGYMRQERVLRPSRVAVSQGPSLHEEDPE
jgi:molecular chaperone GrpE